jgi:hypothetical protein
MQIRFLRTLLLLAVVGLASCEAPTSLPVGSNDPSFGALASSDISTYYYPHHAGVTYVYSNKLTTRNGSTTISEVTGDNDSVRTLGFQGFCQNDSVFAISIKYKVATQLAGRGIQPLRYLPASSSLGGSYINGETAFAGEATTYSLSTRAVSTDSTTAPSYGRLRSFASDLAGSGSDEWQVDIVYFSSNSEHVALYEKTASGTFQRTKDLFRSDVTIQANAEWSYSTWQTGTKIKVISENTPITVGSTNLNAIHASFGNSALNAGSSSERYFASHYGPVRQVETWWTTSDGISRTQNTLVRDAVVILDPDEITSM